MRRREFITFLGGAAAGWPLAVRAQQAAKPVVGFLSSVSRASWTSILNGFHKGLDEAGFSDGQNVMIEYRWAGGQYSRLADLAADLVGRKVAVILAAGGADPAKAVKAKTALIPIVFVSAADPVKEGLVTSLNRPEANVTGVSLLGTALEAKRLGLLHELVPGDASIGALMNPKYSAADIQRRELQEAADAIKRPINFGYASADSEIDTAIATLVQQGVGALLVTQDPFFNNRREQILSLAAHHKLPAIYTIRNYVEDGGLASYGPDFADGFCQAGNYVGKILNGARPADLPVIQPTKFEFVINLKTAKALGLAVAPTLLARVDEVIE
jgi:putative ABC transport system substrate-binding protein